jgi:predicted enzyme related to lactoylglutathione lyase
MTRDKRWARGEFCWYELGTTDPEAAKRFYGMLFDWQAEDMPMPEGTYTLVRLRGEDQGGIYKLQGPHFEGVPPNWLAYVAVDDVDGDSRQAAALGGTVVMGPLDVPDVGRIAVIRDPEGAVIALFQAGKHAGCGRFEGAAGSFCWSELATRDPGAASKFYTRLLGWTAKKSEASTAPYTEWQVGGCSIGGMYTIVPEMGPMPAHWVSYVSVTDCDGTVERARKAGASVVVPPQDIPNVGRFAYLADPQGAVFAVIKVG